MTLDRPEAAKSQKEAIIAEFKSLFVDEEFDKSISAATNNVGNFRTRVSRVQELLQFFLGQ
jgi:hypothetical protein